MLAINLAYVKVRRIKITHPITDLSVILASGVLEGIQLLLEPGYTAGIFGRARPFAGYAAGIVHV